MNFVEGLTLACRNEITAITSDFDQFSMVVAIFLPPPFVGDLTNALEHLQLNSAL